MTGRGGSRGVLGAWALTALVLSGGAPARDAAAEASGAAAEGPSAPAPATEIPPAETSAAETPVAEAAPAGDPSPAALGPATGPVTGLPLPRFVSLKAREARARRGPSLEHRVDWLYRRRGLPLLVTAEHGHWRRVEDIEGYGGWVHYSLISGARTAIVTEDLTALHAPPGPRGAGGGAARGRRDRGLGRVPRPVVPTRRREPPRLGAEGGVVGDGTGALEGRAACACAAHRPQRGRQGRVANWQFYC